MFSQGIVSRFPKSWLCDAVILRSGGKDAKSNPLPDIEIPVTELLISPRQSADPLDRSDRVVADVAIYHDTQVFLPTDKVRIPEGKRMAGLWRVDGRTEEWPMGTVTSVVLA